MKADIQPDEINEEKFFRYFEQQGNLYAKCKICKTQHAYYKRDNCRSKIVTHLKDHIPDEILDIISQKKYENPQKYYDTKKNQCGICKKILDLCDMNSHLLEHNNSEILQLLMKNEYTLGDDYYTESFNFKIKCIIPNCLYETKGIYSFTTLKSHLTSYTHKDKEEEMKSNNLAADKLLKNYHLEVHGNTRCRTCDNDIPYLDVNNFREHINKMHIKVAPYESEHGQEEPWYYFRWCPEQDSVTCVHCDSDVSIELINLEQHIKEHSDKDVDEFLHVILLESYRNPDWIWKYCETLSVENNYEVKCELCSKIYNRPVTIRVEIMKSELSNHLELDECKEERERKRKWLEEIESTSPKK